MRKSYSIRHYVKIALFITFLAVVLDLAITIASISIVKQQSARSLQDTANLYLNRINHDFAYMSHYMGWTLANDDSMKKMTAAQPNSAVFIKANSGLFQRFTELQKNYGQEYNFFVYLKKQDFFLNCAPLSISYPEYRELKEQVESFADRNVYDFFYSNWTPIRLRSRYYVMNIVPYHDRYLISLISADNLIRPLRQIDLGRNGYVSLVDRSGGSLSSPVGRGDAASGAGGERSALLNLFQSRTVVSGQFSQATFRVNLVFQFGAFEKFVIAQSLIMLLFLLIAGTLSVVLFYFNKKVLKPIQIFSRNLALLKENGESLNFQSSRMIELEHANEQFHQLIGQIKKIKIDLYERELDKQKMQLDYMKLQIKPHFFLNCLTSIYSMAQMRMHEEIERMALSTSRYFRYIFQSGNDFVRLEDEFEHARVYLDIQKHRYRDALTYRIEKEQGTEEVRIPPLVIQTFIENAVKYAVSRQDEVRIQLAASRTGQEGEEAVVIRIADTGPGFAPDILEKLRSGQPLDQTNGTRIGIMNTVQRLAYLYRNEANVSFDNRDGGGACVTLRLPVAPPEAV
ncbi:sensor histidine kinase [Cohnella thermotolerans]|uniref:sensor histidine kinase n=1 Tax=Cohnella thermotolerans TaxID=329858 RepID=UPI0004224783|nr:histidine kinase [Cohnella thermotolerans]